MLPVLAAALLSILAAPDGKAEAWAPPAISSPMFESHPAFDPWTGDLYFVRSDKTFSGWRILLSRCTRDGWAAPVDAPFAAPGLEADPWFAPGGRRLYFISTRATGGKRSKDLDIWTVARTAKGGWGKPERLPEPVNSSGAEWFPRLGADGWLYFGSDRPGGQGKTDIWRARQAKGRWTVENLGPGVNTAGDEYEPLPTPDGTALLVQAGSDYFVSRKAGAGWGPRTKLGPAINGNGSEIGALFSPSGRSLMFARDAGEPKSGELMVVRSGREAWPPTCPRR
ncbi:MAG: PD40 domain-containing protein [Caulobacterales bacterium]|nr:PD40 domain-containing protein [Caulobacterales bacterium]